MKALIRSLPFFVLFLVSTGTHAQTSKSKLQAKTLFDEGMALFEHEQYNEACPKFAESLHLYYAMGSQYHLARCHEKRGKLASAHDLYTKVGDAAAEASMPSREKQARERAKALVPRLSRLKLDVPASVIGIPKLEIQINNETLNLSRWGTFFLLDPGEHVITADAPNHPHWEHRVNTSAGKSNVVTVDMVPASSEEALRPEADDRPPLNMLPMAGLAVGGAGIGMMGTSLAFGLIANSKTQEDLAPNPGSLGGIATGMFIGGAVLTGGGLLMWLLAPSEDDADASNPSNQALTQKQPTIGVAVGWGNLQFRGQW